MELPGDLFKPFLGLVNQVTYAPVGRLLPMKATRTTLDASPDKLDTPNNAVPDFMTNIRTKRRTSGTIHQVTFDNAYNIYGNNFYGDAAMVLRDGMVVRGLFRYDTSVPRAGSPILEMVGSPITGSAAELPAFALPSDYVFLAIRIMRIRHEGDAGSGQPFDIDWESAWPYAMPREPWDIITAYGWVNAVGGFM